MNYIKILNNKKKDISDLSIKEIKTKYNTLNIINIETITNSFDINEFILKNLIYLNKLNEKKLTSYLLNYLPVKDIIKLKNIKDLETNLYNGYTIIIINNKNILATETKSDLSRGINEVEYEKTIIGPRDSFNEQFNTNLGLIRKRIKSDKLNIKTYELGTLTKTKVGLIYLNNLTKERIINKIDDKLKKIKVKAIIDSNYLKKYLNTSKSLFPTIKSTERPDLASQSLLEGKVLLLVDNSPELLILPTFFIDYFHTSDDYYQKRINITFIRFIRLIAFLIAIFLPSIYIALTTNNQEYLPINLLLSISVQRQNVPFPAFIEAIGMIIAFEIIRESDIRIPSSMSGATSILAGLILGTATVDAGIISPIMIIVIAISAISGMLEVSIDAINSIRFYRFSLIILSSFLGFYGIFLGTIFILMTLADTKSLGNDFLYPFAPINLKEQKDAILKLDNTINKQNPLLRKD